MASPAEKIRELSRARSEGGLFSAVRSTPGWVWVVIAGVGLLVVGLIAASAWRRSHEE